MVKNKKLIIFDLDGVLIDSSPNMKFALKETSHYLNINLNFNEYKKYIGLPFEQMMKKMGIFRNISLIKKKYVFFSNKDLKKIKITRTNLKILKKLKKRIKLAVFTSKDSKRTKKILSKYRLFDYIITSDDVKKGKPNPDGINKIVKFFKLTHKDTIFVGDSIYDYKSALNANVTYCHALWGYHKLKNSKKFLKIKQMDQLLKFI